MGNGNQTCDLRRCAFGRVCTVRLFKGELMLVFYIRPIHILPDAFYLIGSREPKCWPEPRAYCQPCRTSGRRRHERTVNLAGVCSTDMYQIRCGKLSRSSRLSVNLDRPRSLVPPIIDLHGGHDPVNQALQAGGGPHGYSNTR